MYFPTTFLEEPIFCKGRAYESLWTNKPLRSLGSNQVDFGGMVLPASATAMTSLMLVGCIEKATLIPALTRFSNSCNPRIPPTKSIRLSVFGSWIPKIGESRLFCRIETSSRAIGSSSLYVPGFRRQFIPCPLQIHTKAMSVGRFILSLPLIFYNLKFFSDLVKEFGFG